MTENQATPEIPPETAARIAAAEIAIDRAASAEQFEKLFLTIIKRVDEGLFTPRQATELIARNRARWNQFLAVEATKPKPRPIGNPREVEKAGFPPLAKGRKFTPDERYEHFRGVIRNASSAGMVKEVLEWTDHARVPEDLSQKQFSALRQYAADKLGWLLEKGPPFMRRLKEVCECATRECLVQAARHVGTDPALGDVEVEELHGIITERISDLMAAPKGKS